MAGLRGGQKRHDVVENLGRKVKDALSSHPDDPNATIPEVEWVPAVLHSAIERDGLPGCGLIWRRVAKYKAF